MSADMERGFMFGVRVAEYVHGTTQNLDAIMAALKEIAAGELTIVNTPEEMIGQASPGMPEPLRQIVPGLLNEERRTDRETARRVLDSIRQGSE